jgi:drug/metabolite transporter (DMT)-like permease
VNLQAARYVLLLATLFGTSLVASRLGVGQFSALTYTGLRLTLTSLGHLLVYLLAMGGRRWPTDGRLWRRASFLGMFDTAVPMSCMVLSLQYQSSGLTAILATVGPAITVLLAHFFLPDERLSRRKALGVALAFGGALLLGLLGESGLPDVHRANPIGYLLVLGAMLSASAMTIYTRRQMGGFDSFQVTSVRMFTATLVVLPLSLILVGFDLSRVTWQGYAALGYGALVGTFFAFWLLIVVIQRFGATAAATTLYISPVITSVGGMLVLDETITAGMAAGIALIAAGIALLNTRPWRGS